MLGFLPLAHVPMAIGTAGAITSLAYRPGGLGVTLGVAGACASLFVAGLTVNITAVLLRLRRDWGSASARH